ncbi:hypothetical protein HGRIS_001547 [Hohenbuehelia grisea]|uniref:Retrotransposon Copia-like N-terminal domain-containing protein n=1 Tax=Hohenbuehelia grisea TaxID=104357 RepID=A0ABR3JPM4_9AGAR
MAPSGDNETNSSGATTILYGNNYHEWAPDTQAYLQCKRLWGFIDGSREEPTYADDENPTRQEKLDMLDYIEGRSAPLVASTPPYIRRRRST